MLATAILTATSHLPVLPVVLLDMVGRSKMKRQMEVFTPLFDSLTVRKKMRVYELEVQKNSVTNGSLWVSDSCSGDEVIALN